MEIGFLSNKKISFAKGLQSSMIQDTRCTYLPLLVIIYLDIQQEFRRIVKDQIRTKLTGVKLINLLFTIQIDRNVRKI